MRGLAAPRKDRVTFAPVERNERERLPARGNSRIRTPNLSDGFRAPIVWGNLRFSSLVITASRQRR